MVNHQTEMNSDDKQAFCVRTVILLKCLQEAGYFDSKPKGNNLDEIILSPEELYIGELLFHFQTGIQYNLHAVYQVKLSLFSKIIIRMNTFPLNLGEKVFFSRLTLCSTTNPE